MRKNESVGWGLKKKKRYKLLVYSVLNRFDLRLSGERGNSYILLIIIVLYGHRLGHRPQNGL